MSVKNTSYRLFLSFGRYRRYIGCKDVSRKPEKDARNICWTGCECAGLDAQDAQDAQDAGLVSAIFWYLGKLSHLGALAGR